MARLTAYLFCALPVFQICLSFFSFLLIFVFRTVILIHCLHYVLYTVHCARVLRSWRSCNVLLSHCAIVHRSFLNCSDRTFRFILDASRHVLQRVVLKFELILLVELNSLFTGPRLLFSPSFCLSSLPFLLSSLHIYNSLSHTLSLFPLPFFFSFVFHIPLPSLNSTCKSSSRRPRLFSFTTASLLTHGLPSSTITSTSTASLPSHYHPLVSSNAIPVGYLHLYRIGHHPLYALHSSDCTFLAPAALIDGH